MRLGLVCRLQCGCIPCTALLYCLQPTECRLCRLWCSAAGVSAVTVCTLCSARPASSVYCSRRYPACPPHQQGRPVQLVTSASQHPSPPVLVFTVVVCGSAVCGVAACHGLVCAVAVSVAVGGELQLQPSVCRPGPAQPPALPPTTEGQQWPLQLARSPQWAQQLYRPHSKLTTSRPGGHSGLGGGPAPAPALARRAWRVDTRLSWPAGPRPALLSGVLSTYPGSACTSVLSRPPVPHHTGPADPTKVRMELSYNDHNKNKITPPCKMEKNICAWIQSLLFPHDGTSA